jgi:FAD/FMN-containing dehydrogenase
MAPITRRCFLEYATVAAAASPGSQPIHPASPDARAIRRLATNIAGQVITPDASEYESSRLIFNRAFDKRPALIVRCVSAGDVARALEFSQQHNLPVAVRGGGHNRAGLSVCDDGLVIDLSLMYRVNVDQHRRVVRAGAGALTVHVDAATQPFGLATTLAGCPDVGIAGLTLGGGEGFLMSKYGAACDNLTSARLVTVDGRQLHVDESSNPDLFWAIRGGGGNFGVATDLEFRLHPVPDVLAAALTYPPGRIPELLQALVKFVAVAPDEQNIIAQVLPSAQGARFRVLVCHCGDPRIGNALLNPMRALGPSQEDIRVASYLQTNATMNPAGPVAHFQTNLFFPDLSEATVAAISAAATDAPPNTRIFMVPFYGAVTRVPATSTAFALRSPGFELDFMGRWDNPADKPAAIQWVTALRDKLRPAASGLYVNQLGETSEELVRAAYGGNYSRLATLKQQYDPNNVLRSNQNIRPSG